MYVNYNFKKTLETAWFLAECGFRVTLVRFNRMEDSFEVTTIGQLLCDKLSCSNGPIPICPDHPMLDKFVLNNNSNK